LVNAWLDLLRWIGIEFMVVFRPVKLAVAGLFLIACGSPTGSAATPSPTSAASTPTQSATPIPSPPETLTVAASRYGRIIVDRQGRTLYLFNSEDSTTPKCYAACAAAWPPLLLTLSPVAGGGLSQALIATVARSDGSTQVTYNGHPLYFYAGDRAPGEIKCQAVVEFGGGWFVVDAQGNKITTP
jgi:predicted lipoprotein with Yx(FWY)xxD motif